MLRNILVEKILCERYQTKTEKDCGCKKLTEQTSEGSVQTPNDITSQILSWAAQGLIGTQALTQLISDASKLLKPYNPPESQDRYSPTDTPSVRLIQPDPGLKTPRKSKVKEFGQASGQVISPS
jgi:hypothetical protein